MVQRISIALAIALAGTAVCAPYLTAHAQRTGAIIREAERNRRIYEAAQRRRFEDDLKILSEIADELADLNEPLDQTEFKTIREGGREIDKRIDRITDYLGVDANPRPDPPVAPPSDINVDSIRQLVKYVVAGAPEVDPGGDGSNHPGSGCTPEGGGGPRDRPALQPAVQERGAIDETSRARLEAFNGS